MAEILKERSELDTQFQWDLTPMFENDDAWEATLASLDAYVATGEPLLVAGAFTVDGLGGPFVTGIEGDHHNVVGLSLPLLRSMLLELGVAWPSLWEA